MPEPTLAERHAAIGRLLDEIQVEIDAYDPVPYWAGPLLDFTRAEWSRLVRRERVANRFPLPPGIVTRYSADVNDVIARLESALVALMEGK